MMTSAASLGWLGIIRLGLVQTALGAIVVLTTSTLNRVMVVELALPAMLPGILVGAHYVVQLARPRFGHGSDVGGHRTRWVVGGMAVLAMSGTLAAAATGLMMQSAFMGDGTRTSRLRPHWRRRGAPAARPCWRFWPRVSMLSAAQRLRPSSG
jgi:BCD family chlorophyll transporter-like MFS transporter